MSGFTLGSHRVGAGAPTFVIAEVAQAHDGSLGAAHAYIDAVAGTGAHAIKFQTHIAAAESTPGEPWRVKFSRQDATRYDYWKRMEFTPEQWVGLAEHARDQGLVFLSTPFSFAAMDLLDPLVPAWKVGSGETTNGPMIERMAATQRPVLLSSGMASWAELDEAVRIVRAGSAPLAVFQCTTAYPCPPEKTGLNVIGELLERYGCPVGLSDHSATIYAGLAAVSLGARLLEVHVTLSRAGFGPDTGSSLTPDEIAHLVRGARFIEAAIAHPVDKDRAAADLEPLKRTFGKSVVAARDLAAGQVLGAADLALKKPGTGIPAARLGSLLGRRVRRALPLDTLIAETDLDG